MSLRLAGDILSLTVYSGLILAGLLVIYIWMKNRTKKISALRLFVQAASLLVIFSTVLIIAKWNSVVLAVIIFILPIFLDMSFRFLHGFS